jgi:ELWxxDGT repeat protein
MSDLLFLADDGVHGNTLWRTDGTAAGTHMVRSPDAGGPGEPSRLVEMGGLTYFFAPGGGSNEEALWVTDGSACEIAFRSSGDGPDQIGELVAAGGALYFVASDPDHGAELWTSDGTAGGTHLVEDIDPGPENLYRPSQLTELDGRVYFAATNGDTHISYPFYDVPTVGLYSSDGTEAGTYLVKEPSEGGVIDLTNVGGALFFEANVGSYRNYDLWTSDGTAASTYQVAQISTVLGGIFGQFTGVGGLTFFSAADGIVTPTLFVTDGTGAGTHFVKNPRTESGPDHPHDLVNLNGTLYFGAGLFHQDGGQLWRSDGTASGTVIVSSLEVANLTAFAGKLYFAGDNGKQGFELWVSNGTTSGTHLVKDINPGAGGSDPFDLTVLGGKLYFSAFDPAHGIELWVSDGTAAGTHLVKDIDPGAAGALDPNHDPALQDDSWLISRTDVQVSAALLLANDSDADGDQLTIASVGNVHGGTVSLANGIIDFTPGAGSLSASFDYTVVDPLGASAVATVHIDYAATGSGRDTLDPAVGTDFVIVSGWAGDDSLTGSENGPDTLIGRHGNDTLDGGAGDDRLDGGRGDDLMFDYRGGNDTMIGGAGNDRFLDGPGADLMVGGDGDDRFFTSSGNVGNALTGGAGRDTFEARIANPAFVVDVITDFQTGVGGDVIDLQYHLSNAAGSGDYDPGDNPFITGLLRLTQHGDDVRLTVPGEGYTLFDFRNTRVEDFTSDNFSPGYSPDGIGRTITGTNGPDPIFGTGDADTIRGLAGDDALNGDAGDDRLYGGSGNDTIVDSYGRDTVAGGGGSDTFNVHADEDEDVVSGGGGSDTFHLGESPLYYPILPPDRITDFTAGPGGDVIEIQGFLVNWIISGYHAGDNPFTGGLIELVQSGNETHLVSNGRVALILSDVQATDLTRDNFSPGFSPDGCGDSIDGTGGPDSLTGTINDDTIDGLGGADDLYGGDNDDLVQGGRGNDTVDGGLGDDTLRGGSGNDVFSDGYGVNVYHGDAGNDVFQDVSSFFFIRYVRTNGVDTYTGGAGIDRYEVHSSGAPDIITDFATGPGGDILDLKFWDGQAGNPFLEGYAKLVQSGNDVLLQGYDGYGMRLILVLRNADAASFAADNFAHGFDPHAINVTVGTPGDDLLDGLDGRNLVFALEGNDTIATGALGDNTIVAGEGNNSVQTGAGDDVVDAGSGADTVLSGDGRDVVRSGGGADSIGGEGGDDEIFTAAGNDTADAGFGDDHVDAGDDRDSIEGGDGNDTLYGGAGRDRIDADYGDDFASGDAGNDTIHGAHGNDSIEGGDGNDSIAGDDGEDELNGNAGNDVLAGNADADRLTGGAGSDTFRYSDVNETSILAGLRDVITDFIHAQADRIDLAAVDGDIGTPGNQAFIFIGTGAFTGVAGQLRYQHVGGDTVVEADVHGDGSGDFAILLQNHAGQALLAGDFVL